MKARARFAAVHDFDFQKQKASLQIAADDPSHDLGLPPHACTGQQCVICI